MMEYKPFLISWNTTKRCNLKCKHCYLDASSIQEEREKELSTEEGYGLIDEIAEVNPKTMLVLTGGEPLLREDVLDLAEYGAKRLMVVIGTNGTLINDDVAEELAQRGVMGVGISLDSLDHEIHDSFRGVEGAWKKTIQGIEACKRHGLEFQIQTTVMKENYDEIPNIIEYSHKISAKVFNLFFMVCTGRGQGLTDISPEEYEKMLSYLAGTQKKYSDMMIRARCAPHFMRIISKNQDQDSVSGIFSRCFAGKYYCRIMPEGYVTPCPYLPLKVGNVREKSFKEIWENSEVFNALREQDLKGKCRTCEFTSLCGGCRARSYSITGDFMETDPWCTYEPTGEKKKPTSGIKGGLLWTPEAKLRMEKVPPFLQEMVKKAIERHAVNRGYREINPRIMDEVREKVGHKIKENKIYGDSSSNNKRPRRSKRV